MVACRGAGGLVKTSKHTVADNDNNKGEDNVVFVNFGRKVEEHVEAMAA